MSPCYGGVVFETRLAMFDRMRELSRNASRELSWDHVADDGTHPGGRGLHLSTSQLNINRC